MLFTLVSFGLSLFFPIVIIIATLVLSMRSNQDREKLSPFECGFDPKSNARIPFSLRFFLLAVIFLVFDIEIVLLMPMPLLMDNSLITQVMIGNTLFLMILFIGLLHEWREGSLDWSK